MFCPKCGSNQNDNRRFCTTCGTNLQVISQALTGNLTYQPPAVAPVPDYAEIQRKRSMAKGMKFAVIGGGIVALRFLSFIFSGPFNGGNPFGFWTLVGLILLGIGISRIINASPNHSTNRGSANLSAVEPEIEIGPAHFQSPTSRQMFANQAVHNSEAPDTSELYEVRHPVPSVTEDETRNLRSKR